MNTTQQYANTHQRFQVTDDPLATPPEGRGYLGISSDGCVKVRVPGLEEVKLCPSGGGGGGPTVVGTMLFRFSQTGTEAPVVTELYNDTGFTLVSPTRSAAGQYMIEVQTGSAELDDSYLKRLIGPTNPNGYIGEVGYGYHPSLGYDMIFMRSYSGLPLTPSDNVFKNSYVEILVYEA